MVTWFYMVKGTFKFHVLVTTAIPNGHTNIPFQFSVSLSLLVIFWNLQGGWGSSAHPKDGAVLPIPSLRRSKQKVQSQKAMFNMYTRFHEGK